MNISLRLFFVIFFFAFGLYGPIGRVKMGILSRSSFRKLILNQFGRVKMGFFVDHMEIVVVNNNQTHIR